jgi:hypothetical protein
MKGQWSTNTLLHWTRGAELFWGIFAIPRGKNYNCSAYALVISGQ